ncbi:DUF6228 family protein [Aurantivibrio plasticivorans]
MEFSISSTSSNNKLIFSGKDGEYVQVSVAGDVSARLRVYLYTDEAALLNYFRSLGSSINPWKGEISWESLEGEFKISCSCSSLGAVNFQVHLWGLAGHPEEWRVSLGIDTEFGQLQSIANRATKFFNKDT